ncbi:MAG: aldo/keto reductase [Proteobacteria bacterium]|nr:aldo/keto reductase [Pseudomonadota bacterium]
MTISRRRLHPEGPEFSRIVWGAWRAQRGEETATPKALAAFVDSCLSLGVTTFDHADIYGGFANEALFGKALAELKVDRSAFEIVTKCGVCSVTPARPENRAKHYDASAAYIHASVDRSLANLGTDYVDLLLVHRPDIFTPADETARGLEEVVASGKVRAIGVSNHLPHQLSLLQSRLSLPVVTNQIECSILRTAAFYDGTLSQAQEMRASPMIWSPLGGGALFSSEDPAVAKIRTTLLEIGERYGTTDIGALALAWLMRHPSAPFPVLGSTRIARVREALRADAIALDRQDWYRFLEVP